MLLSLEMNSIRIYLTVVFMVAVTVIMTGMVLSCQTPGKEFNPKAVMIPVNKLYFNSFVDCNMAEAWTGDTFRIFPGKYGEDPLWEDARGLKFADGRQPKKHSPENMRISGNPKCPQTLPRELPDLMVQYDLKPFIRTRTIRAEKF